MRAKEARVRSDHAPRGYGRIIDRAFELYRANFRTIAITSLVVLFPLAMLVGVTQVFSTRGMLQLFGSLADSSPDVFLDQYSQVQSLSLLSNLVSPLFLVARAYLTACLFELAPAMLAGARPGVGELLRAGKSRFLWLLLVSVTVSLAVGTASLFLLIPGLILWARLKVAYVTAVVERAAIDRAYVRSWTLTRGRFWRTVGFAIVLGVIAIVLEAAIDSPAVIRQIVASVESPDAVFRELSPAWKTFEGVLAASATSLIAPLLEFAWFFYYLDLRARHEGMDIVVKAGELAASR